MKQPQQVKTTWEPAIGWLLLTPTTLPEKTEGGLHLPESFVKKSNSGTVVKPNDHLLFGQEVFFPRHTEHQIIDSETHELFYVVENNNVIMHRNPVKQKPVYEVPDPLSRENGDGTKPVAIPTIERSRV